MIGILFSQVTFEMPVRHPGGMSSRRCVISLEFGGAVWIGDFYLGITGSKSTKTYE